jgi:hypothetical protein
MQGRRGERGQRPVGARGRAPVKGILVNGPECICPQDNCLDNYRDRRCPACRDLPDEYDCAGGPHPNPNDMPEGAP